MTRLRWTVVIAVAAVVSLAEEAKTPPQPGWKVSIDANATVTQNYYSDSWTGDERGGVSWASKLEAIAANQFAPWYNHKNTLKLAFGQTKVQEDDDSWSAPKKSTDLIDFESMQRFTLQVWVDPYVALRVLTQFLDKRDTLKTRYLNPIDITESAGVIRNIVEADATKWNIRLGWAGHHRIDRDNLSTSGTGRKTDVVSDAGFEVVSELKAAAKEGLLDFTSLLTLMQSVVSSAAKDLKGTPQEKYWMYPDVNWENILSVNLTKYVMINLTVQVLYDRELHKDARVKEVLAAGLMYKFKTAE